MTYRRSAPAKINLGLHVLRSRPDGYHDVETVLVPIGWYDDLEARPARTLSLACDDPSLPGDDTNLVLRAARALAAAAGAREGAAIRLRKRVPHGAGLGGGSSDAAATLRLLSQLWGIEMPEADLHELAAGLGADVPFFLHPRPAIATGRGDRLEPLAEPAGAPFPHPFAVVVVVPDVRVSTASAYGLLSPAAGARPDLAELLASRDLERWSRELVNDFEAPIVARHPEVGRALDALVAAGAGYTSLSGSGSAVYGVFEDAAAAEAAADEARAAGRVVWVG